MTDYKKLLLAKAKTLKPGDVPFMMFAKDQLVIKASRKKARAKKDKNVTFRINADLKEKYENALIDNHANMTAHLTAEIIRYIKESKQKK